MMQNEQRSIRSIRRFVPGLVILALTVASPAMADPINLLTNGDFSTVGAAGSPASYTGQNFFYDSYNWDRYTGVPAAAAGWGIWNNTYGTTMTELLPSLWPGVSDMIHVVSDGTNNGLLQSFLPFNTGVGNVVGQVAVYVNSGQVGIGIGNGLYTDFDAFSSTTGQWEVINAGNGQSPANEFLLYSANGPADFYAAAASVSPVPEPATLMLFGGGAVACVGRAYRRRRAAKLTADAR
jgi:hypothetical protein